MKRHRVQKKSYKQSLDSIKEIIEEKRIRRLSKVATGRKDLAKNSAAPSKASLLQSLQQNNKDLAAALQVERENLKSANDKICRLRKKNSLMFWHIVTLKRRLRIKEKNTPSDVLVESQTNDILSRRSQPEQSRGDHYQCVIT